jgi:hypothetical protein
MRLVAHPVAHENEVVGASGRPAGRPYNIGYFRDRIITTINLEFALFAKRSYIIRGSKICLSGG